MWVVPGEMNNFDRLLPGYLNKQRFRLRRTIAALNGRGLSVTPGYAIPIEGSLSNGRGRQLNAAVMFLDICGFSRRVSHTLLEQQAILDAFGLLFPELIAIIEDCDGVVEKNTGDGLMAYFVKRGKNNYVQRAIASAMTMLNAAENLIEPAIVARGIEPFQFRIAIDAGPITVAKVGRKTGFGGFVAIGDPANRASKMLAHTDPMTILIGNNAAMDLPEKWRGYAHLKNVPEWKWIRDNGQPYYLRNFIKNTSHLTFN